MSTMESENSVRHDAQTFANPASHFFRLPGELRNQIYACIFPTDVTFSIVRKTRPSGKPTKRGLALHRHSIKPSGISLLFICRQMYYDTLKLLYQHNSFYFNTLTTFTSMLINFSHHQLAALKTLHLKIRVTDEIEVATFLDVMKNAGMPFAKLLPNVRHIRLNIETYLVLPHFGRHVAAVY
ncbi:hypothetical protein FB567DRAFT_50457 [Paraphoma chrysanthemicola]|uniref:DUF7730 domain-containing protein n=1 Tax=Paraphoma chrysanthemicola TaxID=798071 RepID=A0A8K0R3C4_9PLEO|nr:hypothetical protein FB567DRAFT_50457 [Paraphoma chrysanthemicola]